MQHRAARRTQEWLKGLKRLNELNELNKLNGLKEEGGIEEE
jgi:hypothetical protein